MIIVAWVLLICFGLIGFTQLVKYVFSSINIPSAILMFASIVISALAAGVIWGGL